MDDSDVKIAGMAVAKSFWTFTNIVNGRSLINEMAALRIKHSHVLLDFIERKVMPETIESPSLDIAVNQLCDDLDSLLDDHPVDAQHLDCLEFFWSYGSPPLLKIQACESPIFEIRCNPII